MTRQTVDLSLRRQEMPPVQDANVAKQVPKSQNLIAIIDIYSGQLRSGFGHNSHGLCVDTGAPASVVGLKELSRIFQTRGKGLPRLRRSTNRFRFADSCFNSLGQIDLPLATPSDIPPMQVTQMPYPPTSLPYLGSICWTSISYFQTL